MDVGDEEVDSGFKARRPPHSAAAVDFEVRKILNLFASSDAA
jgi:hypothetical protein